MELTPEENALVGIKLVLSRSLKARRYKSNDALFLPPHRVIIIPGRLVDAEND